MILSKFHWAKYELSGRLQCAYCIERRKGSLNREKLLALTLTEGGDGSGRNGEIESLGAISSR